MTEPAAETSRNPAQSAVLVSGGLDSCVLLIDEAHCGVVQPVYLETGLAWESEERSALERFLAYYDQAKGTPAADAREHLRPLAVLNAPMQAVYGPAHWAVRGAAPAYHTADEDVYLAGRNVILLSQAGVFCAERGLSRLVMATLAGNPFPDATAEFRGAMARALALGLGRPLVIDAPYSHLHKPDVVRRAFELGVPVELTLSCMNPQRGKHCGKCSKCREREEAFREAGVSDPALTVT